MTQAIVSIDRVELLPRPAEYLPEKPTQRVFDAKLARLGEKMGLTRLGCSVTAVPPGAVAFPFHNHRANDELFLVLAGRGELRLGATRHPVATGNLIGCPAGGPETAHQLVNNSDTELRYLAISSCLDPEICEYPDSGKVGAYAGKREAGFHHMSRAADVRDYWDDE